MERDEMTQKLDEGVMQVLLSLLTTELKIVNQFPLKNSDAVTEADKRHYRKVSRRVIKLVRSMPVTEQRMNYFVNDRRNYKSPMESSIKSGYVVYEYLRHMIALTTLGVLDHNIIASHTWQHGATPIVWHVPTLAKHMRDVYGVQLVQDVDGRWSATPVNTVQRRTVLMKLAEGGTDMKS